MFNSSMILLRSIKQTWCFYIVGINFSLKPMSGQLAMELLSEISKLQ